MKPVIGVMPLFDTKKNSLWMLPGYLNIIEEAGGVPVVLPYTENEEILKNIDNMIDGYLFTGGNDIDPSLYGELNTQSVDVSKVRDHLEEYVYKLAKEKNKPVLGICRGMQIINVLEGGTLYQDLEIEHPTGSSHIQKPPYDIPHHNLIILLETPLNRLLNTERARINSYHHQGIKKISPNLRIMAMSEDDLVEALYDKKRLFLWGVQWHPEFAPQWDSTKKIMNLFIEKSIEWHNMNS